MGIANGVRAAETILEMKNICKAFSGVPVLKNVDFDLKRGEVHVLVGENGAGKSTLMKVLAGVYSPDGGEIMLKGKKVSASCPHESQSLGISIIYQELSVIPNLTVAQNIFLGRETTHRFLPGVLNNKELNASARDVLQELGIIDVDPGQLVGELPLSKRQMVEIAKAVSRKMDVLIMDEPTSSLSQKEVKELFRLIERLKVLGIGIIYISHRLEEIPVIGDRATVLRDGMVVGTIPVDRTLDPAILVKMMVGKELVRSVRRERKTVGEVALEVKGLSRKGVLEDITFSLHKGEVVGVAGLVGAGRTELARAIYGADPIDKGEIRVFGRKVPKGRHNPRYMKALGVAFLPESRREQGLFLNHSVTSNITIASLAQFCRWGALSRRMERMAALKYVDQLNIAAASVEQEAIYLSGGTQQKVVFSRWLCTNSSIYLLDECTRGIDVGAKFEVFELVRALASQGRALLYISSELKELLDVSDRILVMRRGRLVADISSDAATPEEILRYAFGV